jgi:putative RecB family exonuclease
LTWRVRGRQWVERYLDDVDPQREPIGVERTVAVRTDRLAVSGRVDRIDERDGELVVVDYKTGRAPSEAYEQSKLVGVHIYAMLCEELLGRRPVRVELLHLREPTVITAKPSDQAIRGHRQRTVAVWSAIERACRDEDFRPKTSPLCKHCHFQPFCPAFGGDPAMAAPTLLAPPTVHQGAA